jgi:hypothetical protein
MVVKAQPVGCNPFPQVELGRTLPAQISYLFFGIVEAMPSTSRSIKLTS